MWRRLRKQNAREPWDARTQQNSIADTIFFPTLLQNRTRDQNGCERGVLGARRLRFELSAVSLSFFSSHGSSEV